MLINMLTMAFLKGQSWHVLKSWYTSGGVERGFRPCSTDGLDQSLVLICGVSDVQGLIILVSAHPLTNVRVKTSGKCKKIVAYFPCLARQMFIIRKKKKMQIFI